MVDLVQAACDLQKFLREQRWRFCFIGGLAVQVWGEPRLTRDVDLSLMTGFGNEAAFIDKLLEAYLPRMQDARDFALRHRTLLLRTAAGISIDISLAALPYEDGMMSRSVDVELLPGQALTICTAEDLLVMKLFAGREIDMRDAETVIIRRKSLDWDYVEQNLRVLDEFRESSGSVDRLRQLRLKHS